MPGSLVHTIVGGPRDRLRIGTAGGVLTAAVSIDDAGRVDSVAVGRSARRLADAEIYLPAHRSARQPVGAAASAANR